MATALDRSDPAVRAEQRMQSAAGGERAVRLAAMVLLPALGIAAVVAAEPLTGSSGATVGGALLGLLLVALAVAIRPHQPSEAERRHRRLEGIWREVRPAAAADVGYERYAPWAEQDGEAVVLYLVRRSPGGGTFGAPSPYDRELFRRFDGEAAEEAAQAMEELRAEAQRRELAARLAAAERRARAERAAHERALSELDTATAAELAAREAALRLEMAEEEAAERRARAEALARALRRP